MAELETQVPLIKQQAQVLHKECAALRATYKTLQPIGPDDARIIRVANTALRAQKNQLLADDHATQSTPAGRAELSAVTKQLQGQQTKLDQLQAENSRLRTQFESNVRHIGDLESKVRGAAIVEQSQAASSDPARARLRAQVKVGGQRYRNKLKEKRTALEATVADLNREVARLDAEKTQLSTRIRELSVNQRDGADAPSGEHLEAKYYEAENTVLLAEIPQLLSRNIRHQTSSIAEVRAQIDQARAQRENLTRQISVQGQHIRDLRDMHKGDWESGLAPINSDEREPEPREPEPIEPDSPVRFVPGINSASPIRRYEPT